MRVADGVHVEWVEDEAVILDEDNTQLHYLNSSAAQVYALVEELGFDEAMQELRSRHGAAPFDSGEIGALIEEMTAKGLLVDD